MRKRDGQPGWRKAIVPRGAVKGGRTAISTTLAQALTHTAGKPALLHRLEFRFNTMTMPQVHLTTPASYETALEELEQLVGLIESGQLPLEQLLTGYQRGAELLQYCRGKLQAVENQIKVLDEGTLKPWTQE